MKTALDRDTLARRWRGFAKAKDGNVAMMFAIVIIPVIGLVGAAIDYSHANAVRTRMQAAADSAALAVSKDAASLTSTALETKADKFFKAAFTDPDVSDLQVTATYTRTPNPQVVVKASAEIKPRFVSMSYFGISQIPVDVSSTTAWGNTRLRVALALDNTGSMKNDGKIQALKDATNLLLTKLKEAASNEGDVFVSLIPFSRDVNVGSGYKNESWLDWREFGSCSGRSRRGSSTDYSQYDTKQACLDNGGSWTEKSNHNSWNGCVTDRGAVDKPDPSNAGEGYDQLTTAPDNTKSSSKFPAHNYGYCPQQMIGLTDVKNTTGWTSITDLVEKMSPNGSTNQPIGLVWAWQSLVGVTPLTAPAYDPNYQYRNIIILLSDGLNTQNRWSGNGYWTSTDVDKRMYDSSGKGTCANIKNSPISINGVSSKTVIYTIQVNTESDPTSTLLQNCASAESDEPKGKKFFLVNSASGIADTFGEIAGNLTRLRLAR